MSGYNYQIIREFPDGRTQVIGTYTSRDPRQQRVSVTPGEQYRFGLRSVSTSDPGAFSRALSFIQVTTGTLCTFLSYVKSTLIFYLPVCLAYFKTLLPSHLRKWVH